MTGKKYLEKDVYTSAMERIRTIYEKFDKNVYFSFSGGKDSSVMAQMALEVAAEMDLLPVKLLFIDLEAQYNNTISHAHEIMDRDDVEPYWVCLPIHLRNAVSSYDPQWVCWDPEKRDKWVREIPDGAISDILYFDFYKYGMEFEEFVVGFAQWFADRHGGVAACGVGIRSDESLNRYRTIRNEHKETLDGLGWTTLLQGVDTVYNFYPLYDWRTEDIWTAVGKFGYSYNQIYDLMYQQGKSIHECRICQPYGDDQRRGLDLFRTCEPETWARVVDRVSGANFGNIYCRSNLLGNGKPQLPDGHTWKSYTEFLLETIPPYEAEWYKQKFEVFEKWWEKNGFPKEKWSDVNFKKDDLRLLKQDGTLHKQGPSWQRLAKCILRNDKICKSLSFAQTKNQYRKYREMKEIYGY